MEIKTVGELKASILTTMVIITCPSEYGPVSENTVGMVYIVKVQQISELK